MWMPDEAKVLYDLRSNTPLPRDNALYTSLSEYIDIDQWIRDYDRKYMQWLEEKNSDIYNLDDPINSTMRNAIFRANKRLKHDRLFFWYSVDGSLKDYPVRMNSAIHLHCEPLELPDEYCSNNKYICLTECLVFPDPNA